MDHVDAPFQFLFLLPPEWHRIFAPVWKHPMTSRYPLVRAACMASMNARAVDQLCLQTHTHPKFHVLWCSLSLIPLEVESLHRDGKTELDSVIPAEKANCSA